MSLESKVSYCHSPWKWSEVDWFPNEFRTFTTTWSPTLAVIVGMGHCPFIPIVGRSKAPSGLAVTQPISKSYVTTAACTQAKREVSSVSCSRQDKILKAIVAGKKQVRVRKKKKTFGVVIWKGLVRKKTGDEAMKFHAMGGGLCGRIVDVSLAVVTLRTRGVGEDEGKKNFNC